MEFIWQFRNHLKVTLYPVPCRRIPKTGHKEIMSIHLSHIKSGLTLVLISLILGISLGFSFGLSEDLFKDFVARGIAVNPDLADAKSQDKIWRYAQRAHFHATGIAAFSIGLLLLVAISKLKPGLKKLTSLFIGLGSFYPFAWLSMFLLAPSIGRGPAHSHMITETLTYLGVGSLSLGLLILLTNLFLGGLSETQDT
ncbi:hypothetical protein [Nitrosococcus wardiae]|uniref:Uncharacterized protein n=1 Tax=Nitrosococcus wardiae TaxID=1814290 RepID=A0A4P7BX71_9GAMM|nr:hypothetical protein [Nitrosococcus wardiae]QBQ53690.1 hypothetical protein E3U44_03570 [Nitrosococcus wardiae]